MRNGLVAVAGLVLIRQKPGSAKGVMFITLEDETGIANLIVWPALYERSRRVVLGAGMLGCRGRVQHAGEVTHLIAETLTDLTPMLRRVSEMDEAFPLATGRGDTARHGASPDPRGRAGTPDAAPGGFQPLPRDIYVRDLNIDATRQDDEDNPYACDPGEDAGLPMRTSTTGSLRVGQTKFRWMTLHDHYPCACAFLRSPLKDTDRAGGLAGATDLVVPFEAPPRRRDQPGRRVVTPARRRTREQGLGGGEIVPARRRSGRGEKRHDDDHGERSGSARHQPSPATAAIVASPA